MYNIADIGTKALSRTRINCLLFCAGICDEEGSPIGAAEAAEERRLEVKNAIRRIQVEVKDEFGIPGSRGMTLAKKVLRIGIVSGLVHGNLAWENGDSIEALSRATVWSPITFEFTFDAVLALMISLILLFACIGFICTLQFAFTKQKRYVDVSVQDLELRGTKPRYSC